MSIHRIVAWNRDRGLLDNFDILLEIKMLSEEAREFYMAETFEHRLCEFSDFLFVKEGTKAKYNARLGSPSNPLFHNQESYLELMKWTDRIECHMTDILFSEYEAVPVSASFQHCIKTAMDVVIKNNNLKGKKKDGGKIVKAANQEKPEAVLARLIYGS